MENNFKAEVLLHHSDSMVASHNSFDDVRKNKWGYFRLYEYNGYDR